MYLNTGLVLPAGGITTLERVLDCQPTSPCQLATHEPSLPVLFDIYIVLVQAHLTDHEDFFLNLACI